MSTRTLFSLAAVMVVGSIAPPAARSAIVVTLFPGSAFNASTAIMDATLGITGYQIDTFESTTLLPGLSIVMTGGAGFPQTFTNTLPGVFDVNSSGNSVNNQWDGTHALSNDDVIVSFANGHFATLTTFNYPAGTASFGIGLGNFQSTNPPSPPGSITQHELFVNGVDLGVLETLAGSAWASGFVRNAYLRIDATGGSTITSVGFQNNSGPDFLLFDRLAIQAFGPAVPEPGTLGLLSAAAALVCLRKSKSRPRER